MAIASEHAEYKVRKLVVQRNKLIKKLGGLESVTNFRKFLKENEDDKSVLKKVKKHKDLLDDFDSVESKVSGLGFKLTDSPGGTTWSEK